MQEFAGRITALDPDAGESLKVIAFFDALVAGGAGAESIVRGMVMIGGAAAGAVIRDRIVRIDADGGRAPVTEIGEWPSAVAGDAIRVWIERDAEVPHVNDAMILDRAALALAIVESRRAPGSSSVDILLNAESTPRDRIAAAHQLRMAAGPVRVIATPADRAAGASPTAVLATPEGLVRASLGGPFPVVGPAGVALADSLDKLPQAWIDARTALRLTDERHPVIDADSLGVMIRLVSAPDMTLCTHRDVIIVGQLDERSLILLDVIAESESIRAAAAALGLHHSSVQSRHNSLSQRLGFDPFSPRGRTRYQTARMIARLTARGDAAAS